MRSVRSLALVLVSLLVLSACSSGSDAATPETTDTTEATISAEPATFAPTPAFVSASVERSTTAPHRFEVFVDISASMLGFDLEISPEEPVTSGTTTGSTSQTRTDLGLVIEAMFDELPGGSLFDPEELFGDPDLLFVESILDDDMLYMRAPLVAAIGGDTPAVATEPGFEALAALGDGWGKLDLSATDEFTRSDLAAITGGVATDITELFDVLQESNEVAELGDSTIRGTDVSGLRVTTTLGELIEATGQNQSGGLLPSMGTVDEAISSSSADIDMWVDELGQIRRLSFALDVPAPEGEDGGFRAGTTVEFFDYGADLSIDIPTDATDLTDTLGSAGITS